MTTVIDAASARAFAVAIGQNLRRLRTSRGWSLRDVEEQSGGRWKAVVVGSYERADRNPSVVSLAALCAWYGVDMSDVIPSARPVEVVSWEMAKSLPSEQVVTVPVKDKVVFLHLRQHGRPTS